MSAQPRTKLTSVADLSLEDIDHLFSLTTALKHTPESQFPLRTLQGKTVGLLFFENSTRTKNSFDLAIRRLGGSALSISPAGSSLSKGETLWDTLKTIESMGCHAFVIRHSCSGAADYLAQKTNRITINAGDGFHEHPTQALLDAYTLYEKWGTLHGKKILIVGDIAHSRVARSNITLLTRLGAQIEICAPPTLTPVGIEKKGCAITHNLDESIKKTDAIMMLRIQLERQEKFPIPSLSEYRSRWGLTTDRLRQLKPEAWILHPGPINRGLEIAATAADGPQSLISEQVHNGVWMRMALLTWLLEPLREKKNK